MTADSTSCFSSCSSTTHHFVATWWQAQPPWNEPEAALCHRTRPPPARRRAHPIIVSSANKRQLSVPVLHRLSILFLSLCLLLFAPHYANGQSLLDTDILPRELLFDRTPSPLIPRMLLEARQQDETSSSIIVPSTTILPSDATATASGLTVASATGTTGLPTPFDSTIGNNFTSPTCPQFFNSFLQNQAFQNCLPLSLLLQTSNGFFVDSRSFVRLTQVLDATCKVDFNTCSSLMSSLAQQIQSPSNCGADFKMDNPLVTQAYNGFIAYPTLYHAGCLTDADGNYCFADAVTNASAPSSSYIYYLPLGVALPGASRPACTQCLQNTMAVFATTANNASQPLNKDYEGAANQVQMNCGPTFVSANVAHSSAAAAGPSTPASSTLTSLAGAVLLLSLVMNLL